MWGTMMSGWLPPDDAYAPMSWPMRPRSPRSLPSGPAASSSSKTVPWACTVVAVSSLREAVQPDWLAAPSVECACQ